MWRIAITYRQRERTGGADAYLEALVPALVGAGHVVAFFHERAAPADDDSRVLALPEGVVRWCVEQDGVERAVRGLADWVPDLVFAHGLSDAALERRTCALAPTVFLAHAYYGTCISGSKAFAWPVARTCSRRFGAACLACYLPRRCGGLSPRTMWREYVLQSARLELLLRCAAIVTLSEHMRREYLGHGLGPDRVVAIPPFVPDIDPPPGGAARILEEQTAVAASRRGHDSPWRVVYAGRLERLKGVRILFEALELLDAPLPRRLHLVVAGDGPDRELLERHARGLMERRGDLTIEFTGWLAREAVRGLWRDADLAVVPSVWPEPFGLVGLEAGQAGVPVVAFDVGGIRDWLTDGVNGALVPATPPRARSLAEAMLRVLRDEAGLARMRVASRERARGFSLEAHRAGLSAVFERVLGERSRRDVMA